MAAGPMCCCVMGPFPSVTLGRRRGLAVERPRSGGSTSQLRDGVCLITPALPGLGLCPGNATGQEGVAVGRRGPRPNASGGGTGALLVGVVVWLPSLIGL